MKRYMLYAIIALCLALPVNAQPEFYSDAFLGFPEFRALPVLLPSPYPDSVQIEVHVRIVYDDLQFTKEGEIYKAGYGLDIILRDKEDNLAELKHIEREVTAFSYAQTNSRQQGDQTSTRFTLPMKNYHLRINLVDRESRKSRSLEKALDFPDKYWKRDLRLGDLVLVDSSGTALLTSGIIRGQPLRVLYRLYSETKEGLSFYYQLFEREDRIALAGQIILSGEGPYFENILDLPTDSLTSHAYHLLLVAQQGETTLSRGYAVKILTHDLPDYIQDINLAIRQLRYIATDEEYNKLMDAPSSKKEQLFREFWKKKDPSPATPANEKMEEYYRRIKYANEQFSGHHGGWLSDMGRVYVTFGAPTDIERHPFDIDSKPYEIWYYYDINRKFIFVDEEGFGDYRLVSSFWDDY
ncbi:MAG TPA: GWxTD domain-containing protein [Bacteroidetes bacterium]|nr:GWxTD domain-containing protein [Bacteroidota bacterium]